MHARVPQRAEGERKQTDEREADRGSNSGRLHGVLLLPPQDVIELGALIGVGWGYSRLAR